MKRAFAVAGNTFRETIRDRVLFVIMLFAALMILASLWLASISLGQEQRLMVDFGLLAVMLFGLVVAVFVAASLVRKEVDKRTVYVLFTKPVGRGEFIWGKFAGLALTTLLVIVGMGGFLFLLVWAVTGDPLELLLVATLLVFVQLLAVMGATILFSTITSPIIATVLGVTIFIAGQLSHNVLSLSEWSKNPVSTILARAVFLVVPNLSAVDLRAAIVGETTADWLAIGAWTLYLFAYVTLTLIVATVVFRRKEF